MDEMELFRGWLDEGWMAEFDDPFGVWITPDGDRIESDHPNSPVVQMGWI